MLIDWGELRNCHQISEQEFLQASTDPIAHQSFLKKITAFPIKKNSTFDGYQITLSEIKAENVKILKARQEDLQSNLGDIRFTLYGKISQSQPYLEYETIEEPIKDIDRLKNYQLRKPRQVKHTSNIFNGCFTGLAYLFAIVPIIGLILFFISIGWLPTLILFGLIGLFWIFNKSFESNIHIIKTGGCLSRVFTGIFTGGITLVISWTLLAFAMRSCEGNLSESTYNPPGPIVDQQESNIEEEIISYEEPDVIPNKQHDQTSSTDNEKNNQSPIIDTLIMHNRVWRDYRGEIHNMKLTISKREIRTSKRLRDQIKDSISFGEVYKMISVDNEAFMNRIYDSLDSLRQQKQLSHREFAEVIVSMVQDIPYKLILNSDCIDGAQESSFVKDYLAKCNEPCCLGNIKFGIQTPSEFMGNLYGDCDTRTLFLYTILNHYNYDVGILNSEALSHSVLAINLPYSGQFKYYNNKKYYVWETTNVDYVPGYIDPQYNSMQLWEMVITSK